MTERTALFLASLSHRWFLLVLLLPVLCGAAAYYVGGWWTRANMPAQRFSFALRVLSYAPFLLSCAVFIVAFFHVGCASLSAHSSQCLSNIKQLSIGALMYAQDNDERLPASASWASAIEPKPRETATPYSYAGIDPFRCPAAESPASYGMNVFMGGKAFFEMEAPSNTVLLFDADAPIRSFAGRAESVARTRHNGAPNMAFADGHAKWVNAFTFKKLIWTPTQEAKPKH